MFLMFYDCLPMSIWATIVADADCRWFEGTESFCSGRCGAAENAFVKEYKGVCPAVIKKPLFDLSFLED